MALFQLFFCFLFFRLQFFDAAKITDFIVLANSFASEFSFVDWLIFSNFSFSFTKSALNCSSYSSFQIYPSSLLCSVIGGSGGVVSKSSEKF